MLSLNKLAIIQLSSAAAEICSAQPQLVHLLNSFYQSCIKNSPFLTALHIQLFSLLNWTNECNHGSISSFFRDWLPGQEINLQSRYDVSKDSHYFASYVLCAGSRKWKFCQHQNSYYIYLTFHFSDRSLLKKGIRVCQFINLDP